MNDPPLWNVSAYMQKITALQSQCLFIIPTCPKDAAVRASCFIPFVFLPHTITISVFMKPISKYRHFFLQEAPFPWIFCLNSRCLQEENTLLKYLLQIFKLRCAMTCIIPRVMTIVWTLLLLVTSKHLNMFVDYLFLLKATRYYIVLFSMYLMNDV